MLKLFWKYGFPPAYGLLVYFTIRLVNDSVSDTQIWDRDWRVVVIELATVILFGYVLVFAFNHLEKKIWDKEKGKPLRLKHIALDFLRVYGVSVLLTNVVVIPVVALTDDGLSTFDFIQINTIPILYILLYYAIRRGNHFLQAYILDKTRLEQARSEQLQTELKLLKNQLHPHFLFNAINTVYFQMDESVEAAKSSLERLSELLRYQLYLPEGEPVSLRKEVEHLESYIQLQKARSSESLQLEVDLQALKSIDITIQPLLLLPLVENAFKHVGGEQRISISGKLEEKQLIFIVKNTFEEGKTTAINSGGIGLKNLQRRLELLLPDQHELKLRKEGNWFEAELKISQKSSQT